MIRKNYGVVYCDTPKDAWKFKEAFGKIGYVIESETTVKRRKSYQIQIVYGFYSYKES